MVGTGRGASAAVAGGPKHKAYIRQPLLQSPHPHYTLTTTTEHATCNNVHHQLPTQLQSPRRDKHAPKHVACGTATRSIGWNGPASPWHPPARQWRRQLSSHQPLSSLVSDTYYRVVWTWQSLPVAKPRQAPNRGACTASLVMFRAYYRTEERRSRGLCVCGRRGHVSCRPTDGRRQPAVETARIKAEPACRILTQIMWVSQGRRALLPAITHVSRQGLRAFIDLLPAGVQHHDAASQRQLTPANAGTNPLQVRAIGWQLSSQSSQSLPGRKTSTKSCSPRPAAFRPPRLPLRLLTQRGLAAVPLVPPVERDLCDAEAEFSQHFGC